MPNRSTATIALVLRRQRRANRVGRDVAGVAVDVAEDGCGAHRRDRLGGRIEGEGGHDHLVTRFDTERAGGDRDRVGAVADADRVSDAHVGTEFLLESLDLRAEDEATAVDHGADALEDHLAQRREWRFGVEQGYRHENDLRRTDGPG